MLTKFVDSDKDMAESDLVVMKKSSEKKGKKKRRSRVPKMSPNLASKFAQLQQDSKPITKAYNLDKVGRLEKGLEQQFQEKEYDIQLQEVSNISKDQIKKATTYKTLDKKQNKVHKLKKRKSAAVDAQSESATVTALRRDKEQEHTMRIKATENLQQCQKTLQNTQAALQNRDYIVEQLKRQNAALRKQIKKLQLKAPMNKKQIAMVKDNIDAKSHKILRSKKKRELFEGVLYCEEENTNEERNTYQERWAKLTNIGEMVLYENENANDALFTIDLVDEFKQINEDCDGNNKFELIAPGTEDRRMFKGVSKDYIAEWIGNIKVVQYYFKVKMDYNEEEEQEEEEEEEEIEEKEEEEQVIAQVEKKIEETDPFWSDIAQKMDDKGYKYMKEKIPNREEMGKEDLAFNKWKDVLWKKDYGEFELSCSVQLIRYDTGNWDEDENNILYASVSKYGTASYAAWDKIAENLNRPVKDVMKKYSQLVGIKYSKLKKMAVARG
eukprot:171187_1